MITADDIIRKVLRLGPLPSQQEILRIEIIDDVRALEQQVVPTMIDARSPSTHQPRTHS